MQCRLERKVLILSTGPFSPAQITVLGAAMAFITSSDLDDILTRGLARATTIVDLFDYTPLVNATITL